MRIIFINRFFYPDHAATSQILTDLVFEFAAGGGDIQVVTSRQRYDEPKASLSAREVKDGVAIYRVWTTRFGRGNLLGRTLDYLTFYASVAWRLACILRRNDIVVAKTDPPLISVVAMVVAKLKGAVLVNWIQDLFPEVAVALEVKGVSGFFSSLLQKLRNVSLETARINVVIGERMAGRLIEEGVNPDRIKVIHNWSDGRQIGPILPEENKLRKEWGLSGKFVVGYSGNMGRAHEFETALGAAQILKDEKNMVFLFAGDGQKRPWIEEEARKRGLSNFLFKSYQPYANLSESLSAADIHLISLLPELEGLIVPSKFYGIAAAGRPTLFIGDTQGEIARIISEEECGFTVAVGQSEMLADYIRMFAKDRDLLKRLGQNARVVFERKFDKPLALQAWKEILEKGNA